MPASFGPTFRSDTALAQKCLSDITGKKGQIKNAILHFIRDSSIYTVGALGVLSLQFDWTETDLSSFAISENTNAILCFRRFTGSIGTGGQGDRGTGGQGDRGR